MTEPNGENDPLLGLNSSSPAHSSIIPNSTSSVESTPQHTAHSSPATMKSSTAPGTANKIPSLHQAKHQSSMDSGCESDNIEESDQHFDSSRDTDEESPAPPSSFIHTSVGGNISSVPGPSGVPQNYGNTNSSLKNVTHVEIENNERYSVPREEERIPHRGSSSSVKETTGTKVTFVIEGTEGEEDDFDNGYPDIQTVPARQLTSCLGNRIPSFTLPSTLSITSSTTSMPFCRICHHPEGDGVETLISPCRCSGTMKFIHHGCLMKWLEVSGIRTRQVPTCELCNYQFHRRKKFRIRQCQMPACSSRDKVLHFIFLLCLLVMLSCAAVTVVCFKQNSNPRINREDTELTNSEVVTLTCGVLFFVAFFVAMYVEVKASDTLYRLCSSFFYMNQTMHIYEYDKKRDLQQCGNNEPV